MSMKVVEVNGELKRIIKMKDGTTKIKPYIPVYAEKVLRYMDEQDVQVCRSGFKVVEG